MGLVQLPEYVAFKGNNGKFLAARVVEGHNYHQFHSNDIGDETVRFQVFPDSDKHGKVRIKSLYWNKFWRRSPNWIWADTDNPDYSNSDLLFEPVKVNDHTVALRCQGNGLYCKGLTTEGKTDCLNAGANSIVYYARLVVVEPVLQRKVYSVVYDSNNATISDIEKVDLDQSTATNNSNVVSNVVINFSYPDKKSKSWSNSVSFTTGIHASMTAGIPEISSSRGKYFVNVHKETTFENEWGTISETKDIASRSYTATLNPGQSVTVKLVAKQAKCDVKFSYVQEDTPTIGDTVSTAKKDGVFRGMNYFDLSFEQTVHG